MTASMVGPGEVIMLHSGKAIRDFERICTFSNHTLPPRTEVGWMLSNSETCCAFGRAGVGRSGLCPAGGLVGQTRHAFPRYPHQPTAGSRAAIGDGSMRCSLPVG
jgi:hypothetical protein